MLSVGEQQTPATAAIVVCYTAHSSHWYAVNVVNCFSANHCIGKMRACALFILFIVIFAYTNAGCPSAIYRDSYVSLPAAPVFPTTYLAAGIAPPVTPLNPLTQNHWSETANLAAYRPPKVIIHSPFFTHLFSSQLSNHTFNRSHPSPIPCKLYVPTPKLDCRTGMTLLHGEVLSLPMVPRSISRSTPTCSFHPAVSIPPSSSAPSSFLPLPSSSLVMLLSTLR